MTALGANLNQLDCCYYRCSGCRCLRRYPPLLLALWPAIWSLVLPRPHLLSLYSFPPSSRITSLICTGILSIHRWIRHCSKSYHASFHAFVASTLEFGALFTVVALFIYRQHCSIIFKSGEFPDQSNC